MSILKRENTKISKDASVRAVFYGIAASMLMLIFLFLFRKLGLFQDSLATSPLSWFSYMLLIVCMIFCALKTRKTEALNIRRAYLLCVYVGLCAVVAYSTLLYLYMQYLDRGFLQVVIEQKIAFLNQMEALDENIKIEQTQYIKMLSSVQICLQTLKDGIMAGVLFPLLLAFILRNEK